MPVGICYAGLDAREESRLIDKYSSDLLAEGEVSETRCIVVRDHVVLALRLVVEDIFQLMTTRENQKCLQTVIPTELHIGVSPEKSYAFSQ